MRTTFLIPDDLFREVKTHVAERGATMTSFVEEALRDALRRHAADPARVDVVLPAPSGEGGLLPGVDLSDTAALLDVMESQ